MPRSSESIAALAAALAKAQAELVNPEKSITATIRGLRPGEGDRSFQYAPLSSGLDIVRKTLGQHEIATLQTTDIDQPSGMVNLTTTLAHSSGEWIASDWPVCPVAELANPQRMGLALTYARRYALFTLAGIAGEDDLDAPDLCSEPNTLLLSREGASQPGDGQSPLQPSGGGTGRSGGKTKAEPKTILDPAQSAELRNKLLLAVRSLESADLAPTWARQALAAKNSLTEADAKLVEVAFEQKLSEFPSAEEAASVPAGLPMAVETPQQTGTKEPIETVQSSGIDKSVLAIASPRRYRNREHLRYVMKQPCLVCGRKPSDPHHLRYLQPRALGRKASDEFTVPLCRVHHRAAHRASDERAWWRQAGIDPINVARRLWKATRGIGQRQPQRAASPRAHAAFSSPKSEDIGANATTQEGTHLPDLPG